MNLFGLEPDEFRNVLLSVGSHRGHRPLSPVEVGILFSKMRASGASIRDCAAAMHLEGATMISRFLKLLDLDADVQHLVDWGHSEASIGFTAAFELARLKKEQQQSAANLVIENQLTSAEVRQIVQRSLRAGSDPDESTQEIVKLRSSVEKRYLYIGAITNSKVSTDLSRKTQEQRDSILLTVLNGILQDVSQVSAHLGRHRFTLASPTQITNSTEPGNDLEARVNNGLVQRLSE